MKNERAHLEQEMATLFAAKTKFLIIDTETTGFLDMPDGQIIELACIDQEGRSAFTRLIKPDCAIPAKASAVHGLYARDLVDAPPFAAIWAELLTVLVQYPLIFAYNVDFDRGMLLKTARRFHCAIPDWLLDQEWRCMQEAYARYHGDWSEYHGSYTFKKLSVACAQLKVPLSETHRATGDALNTLALMKALAARATLSYQDTVLAEHPVAYYPLGGHPPVLD
jgi:DNA polymerase III subunit epsilon